MGAPGATRVAIPALDPATGGLVCEALLASAAGALRQANAMPPVEALERCAALDPALRAAIAGCSSRVASLVAALSMRYGAPASPFEPDSEDEGLEYPLPVPPEAVYDAVVSAIDTSLDQTNTALDKAAGIRNAVAVTSSGGAGNGSASGRRKAFESPRFSTLDIPKPQLNFPDYPVDNSDTPFVPHALMAKADTSDLDAHLQTLIRNNAAGNSALVISRHPLEDQIAAAAQKMAEAKHDLSDCTLFRPLAEHSRHVIEAEEELFEAAQVLHSAPAIAVDLEHHDVRSFQGFTCLLQMSTRSQDFVIDAIALRGCIGRALAPIFADPNVVKVLHGANHDVQWLERDFGIYVVNLFDTGQACRLLQYRSKGLSYLLKLFADIDSLQKRTFQIADWRQRPLPEAMIGYAISDTHYLLYIYDRLRAELQKKKLLEKAWLKSADVARIRYSKARFDPNQHLRLAAKYGLCFNPRQMRILAELCRWRDTVAREEDESVPFVLANASMFTIVRCHDEARTEESLLLLLNKMASPIVRKHAQRLADLVSDAVDAKLPADTTQSSAAILEDASKREPRAVDNTVNELTGDLPAQVAATKQESPGVNANGVRKSNPVEAFRPDSALALSGPSVGTSSLFANSSSDEECAESRKLGGNQDSPPGLEQACSPGLCLEDDATPNKPVPGRASKATLQKTVAVLASTATNMRELAILRVQPVRRSTKSSLMGLDSLSESEDDSPLYHDVKEDPANNDKSNTQSRTLEEADRTYRPAELINLESLRTISRPETDSNSSNIEAAEIHMKRMPTATITKSVADSSVEREYQSLRETDTLHRRTNRKRRALAFSDALLTSEKATSEDPVVVPFDYEAERKKRKIEKGEGELPKSYNPMASLLETRYKRTSKARPARKNPKSGERSMSFR